MPRCQTLYRCCYNPHRKESVYRNTHLISVSDHFQTSHFAFWQKISVLHGKSEFFRSYKHSVDLSFFQTSDKRPWRKNWYMFINELRWCQNHKIHGSGNRSLPAAFTFLTTSELIYDVILSMERRRRVVPKLSCPDITHP